MKKGIRLSVENKQSVSCIWYYNSDERYYRYWFKKDGSFKPENFGSLSPKDCGKLHRLTGAAIEQKLNNKWRPGSYWIDGNRIFSWYEQSKQERFIIAVKQYKMLLKSAKDANLETNI